MMEMGCVRYVALLGQADIRRRARVRFARTSRHEEAAATTDTNSRKEQRHGAWV
jgi:hypothetical protein